MQKNGGNFRFGVLNSVRANLANQPAVDAVPVVHGRWRLSGNPYFGEARMVCSECNTEPDSIIIEKWDYQTNTMVVRSGEYKRTKYCPNCGAKMDGDGDG